MILEELTKLIHDRRSIFPKVFTGERIPDEIIGQILENANQAPSHKHTEPWRFHIITNEKKDLLGEFFQKIYRENVVGENFKQKKHDKFIMKTGNSSHIIAIGMQRDPDESIPEWEEIAAVACAVQNIYLSLTAANLGGYWSSPKLMIDHIADFINLEDGEICLGFFYMGVPKEGMSLSVEKKALDSKVKWYS